MEPQFKVTVLARIDRIIEAYKTEKAEAKKIKASCGENWTDFVPDGVITRLTVQSLIIAEQLMGSNSAGVREMERIQNRRGSEIYKLECIVSAIQSLRDEVEADTIPNSSTNIIQATLGDNAANIPIGNYNTVTHIEHNYNTPNENAPSAQSAAIEKHDLSIEEIELLKAGYDKIITVIRPGILVGQSIFPCESQYMQALRKLRQRHLIIQVQLYPLAYKLTAKGEMIAVTL